MTGLGVFGRACHGSKMRADMRLGSGVWISGDWSLGRRRARRYPRVSNSIRAWLQTASALVLTSKNNTMQIFSWTCWVHGNVRLIQPLVLGDSRRLLQLQRSNTANSYLSRRPDPLSFRRASFRFTALNVVLLGTGCHRQRNQTNAHSRHQALPTNPRVTFAVRSPRYQPERV